MSTAEIRLTPPSALDEFVCPGPVNDALRRICALVDAELVIEPQSAGRDLSTDSIEGRDHFTIVHRGKRNGYVVFDSPRAAGAAQAIAQLLAHMLDREVAVVDLVEQLFTSYQELDVLYTLLPTVALKIDPREIGDAIVKEAAKTLHCRRVSLLVLDEKQKCYHVLASCGLPEEAKRISIPVCDSIAGKTMFEHDLLVIDSISDHPELEALSRGAYDSKSFAVVRVPLTAHGQALGVLTVTEREGDSEFTVHDRKILEGLSAMGASALLNCRLHEAASKQMMCTIHALASAVDARDHYTHDHAGRVSRLCTAAATEMGVTDRTVLRQVELAALLHDIGKIGIPDAILSKPERLTPKEFKIMQSHVIVGARIVEHVQGLERVAEAILHHHERHDGLGYPAGLSGDAIPIASTLIAVTDTFDALTSDRPYRKAGTIEDAIREIRRCAGTQFNPSAVEALETVVHRESQQGMPRDEESESVLAIKPALI